MKNRERQRENRRKYCGKQKYEKPWLNREGYYDPTAYKGMQRAMKAEKETK